MSSRDKKFSTSQLLWHIGLGMSLSQASCVQKDSLAVSNNTQILKECATCKQPRKCFVFLERHSYPDLPPAAIIQLEIHGLNQTLKCQHFIKLVAVAVRWTTVQLPFPPPILMNPWWLILCVFILKYTHSHCIKSMFRSGDKNYPHF